MVNSEAMQLALQALWLVLLLSAPPVVVAALVGLLIAFVQAATQIQEQTLSFAPKLVVIFGVLALAGPWMGSMLLRFTFNIFDRFPAIIGH